MNQEKWLDVVSKIKEKFDVLEHEIEELIDMPGIVEYIIFVGPLGKVKLERTVKPVVLDKKTTFSRRVGSDVKVEYVYSDTETVDKIKAYQWDDSNDDWREIETPSFGF